MPDLCAGCGEPIMNESGKRARVTPTGPLVDWHELCLEAHARRLKERERHG